jgi:hypothetical protein
MRRFLAIASVITALAAALVLAAPVGATGPATTSLAIGSQASFGPAPNTIVVTVVFQCPAGESGIFGVFVSQPQSTGPNVQGSTTRAVTCDGTKQTIAVTLPGFGVWTAGKAHAQAEGVAGSFNQVFTSKEITIS